MRDPRENKGNIFDVMSKLVSNDRLVTLCLYSGEKTTPSDGA